MKPSKESIAELRKRAEAYRQTVTWEDRVVARDAYIERVHPSDILGILDALDEAERKAKYATHSSACAVTAEMGWPCNCGFTRPVTP